MLIPRLSSVLMRRVERELTCSPARGQKRRRASPLARGAEQDRPYGGRPPATATVGGWHAVGREVASDLTQCSTVRVLEPYAVDNMLRKRRRTSGRTGSSRRTCPFELLAEEALDFVDGDQPLTPGGLDGVYARHDSAIDRRDADAESLGRLPTAVREALDRAGLAELDSAG